MNDKNTCLGVFIIMDFIKIAWVSALYIKKRETFSIDNFVVDEFFKPFQNE